MNIKQYLTFYPLDYFPVSSHTHDKNRTRISVRFFCPNLLTEKTKNTCDNFILRLLPVCLLKSVFTV